MGQIERWWTIECLLCRQTNEISDSKRSGIRENGSSILRTRNNQSDCEEPSKNEDNRRKGQRDLQMNHMPYIMLNDAQLRHYDMKDYRMNRYLQIDTYHGEHRYSSGLLSKRNRLTFSRLLFSSCCKYCRWRWQRQHQRYVLSLPREHFFDNRRCKSSLFDHLYRRCSVLG